VHGAHGVVSCLRQVIPSCPQALEKTRPLTTEEKIESLGEKVDAMIRNSETWRQIATGKDRRGI
jgi:hypothetical protein